MTLKQIKDFERIIFLKQFTEQILTTLAEKHHVERKIKEEKIKQKYVKSISSEIPIRELSNSKILAPILYSKKQELEPQRKKIFHRAKIPDKIPIPTFRKKIPKQYHLRGNKQIQPRRFKTNPSSFSGPLAKIEQLLRDNTIQSIECAGPGKNLVIKRINKMNITQINLTQPEIKDIINYFANQAKIPIVGGILKAAIKNIVISAIESEFVGSRFIINKITPYSLIVDSNLKKDY